MKTERMNRLLQLALAAGLLALLVLALLLFTQYQGLEREHLVGGRASLLTSLKQTGTLEPRDASLIASWMTFDYINYVDTSLPPSYLQGALSISDPRYPRVTIEEYAEDAHLSSATTLEAAQAAVRSYAPAQ